VSKICRTAVDGVCIPEESSPYSASSANSLQVDVKIPTDIAPGDYLLRAEVIALHTAASLNSAQFYASCYQITVSGSGSATPSGVLFPGAYKNTDPGILVDIHAKMSSYVDPGPTVYAGGVSKTPGNSKCSGQAASEGPGGKPATGVSDRSSSKVHDSGES
jgi:cellulase